MTIGHLPSGYVLAYLMNKRLPWKLKTDELRKYIFFLMLGSVFPDIDTLPFLMEGAGLSTHRLFVTHTPFLYMLIAVVVAGYGLILNKDKRRYLYLGWVSFLVGCVFHLVGDSFFYGVRWLYPISNDYYGLFPGATITFSNLYEMMSKYILSIFFVPDFIFCVLALWIFFAKRFGISKKKFG